MIEWDDDLGLVDRGTPGHHASAEVDSLGAEVAALDRIQKDSKWMTSEISYGTTYKQALKQGSINRQRRKKIE